MRILVVGGDHALSALLRERLEEARFEVELAADGPEVLSLARGGGYGVIVIDRALPGMSGLDLCRALRERRNITPVLMLTAQDSVEDRVRGLECGADDCLPKPFAFEELLARVRALLRRDKIHRTRVIRIADLEIDTAERRVTRAGRLIHLTPREYALLEALAFNEGRVLTQQMIQERVWQDDDSYSNIVNVHVAHLRKKVDLHQSVKLIRTIHGVGYTLRGPDSESAG
jgi:two-component system copper resistance phosphate regulon response regulator CusR